MNAARHHELQASLGHELHRQTDERNLSSTGRVVWLLDQIENYVERWLALRTSAGRTMAPADDDLFGMIEIGAKMTSTELQAQGTSAFAERWLEFLAVLEAARAETDVQRLTESLAAVRLALCELGR